MCLEVGCFRSGQTQYKFTAAHRLYRYHQSTVFRDQVGRQLRRRLAHIRGALDQVPVNLYCVRPDLKRPTSKHILHCIIIDALPISKTANDSDKRLPAQGTSITLIQLHCFSPHDVFEFDLDMQSHIDLLPNIFSALYITGQVWSPPVL